MKGFISKETVVSRLWGTETRKRYAIKRVDKGFAEPAKGLEIKNLVLSNELIKVELPL